MRNRAPARGGKKAMCRDSAPVSAHSVPLGCNSNVSRGGPCCQREPAAETGGPQPPHIQSARSTSDAQASNSQPRRDVAIWQAVCRQNAASAGVHSRPWRAETKKLQDSCRLRQLPARASAAVLPGRQPSCGLGGALSQSVDIYSHAVILISCAGSKRTWQPRGTESSQTLLHRQFGTLIAPPVSPCCRRLGRWRDS